MKKIQLKVLGSFCAISLLMSVSCSKNSSEKEITPNKENSTEISMEQDAKILKNNKGESITIIYHAIGDEVGVKLTKDGKEHQLKAKGSSNKGEPIFTDGILAWEIMNDGVSGKLVDKSGEAVLYKQEQ